MCQWKFLVFRYRANTSARMAFMAPAMSLVAERVRSVGVASGASRSRRSCEVFAELFLLILFFLCVGLILSGLEPAGPSFPSARFVKVCFIELLLAVGPGDL